MPNGVNLYQQVSSSGKGSKMENTADQDKFDVISIIIIINPFLNNPFLL